MEPLQSFENLKNKIVGFDLNVFFEILVKI